MTSPNPIGEGAREIAGLMAAEEQILEALTAAYQDGRMIYAHYSPAYDVTAARAAALSFLLASTQVTK